MNNKIGIITLYHNSQNYGGLLQAYALVHYLNGLGYTAEQIDFDNVRTDLISRLKKNLKTLGKRESTPAVDEDILKKLNIRESCLKKYREENIPHSSKVYNYSNINELNRDYDIFICGSDQIWNYRRSDAYYLQFAEESKIKFSFSAGMSNVLLNKKDRKWTISALEKLDGISVREEEIIKNLKGINKEITVTVDPTLLVDAEDWKNVEIQPSVSSNKYLLCYFLSPDLSMRKMAQEYATLKKLKIVTVPNINKSCINADKDFGDIQLIELSPPMLLGYIDNADAIITDSFHITLFSCLFNKYVYTFSRSEHPEMSPRITNLLKLFGRNSRLIDVSEKTELNDFLFMESCNGDLKKLETMKLQSQQYIKRMLDIKK